MTPDKIKDELDIVMLDFYQRTSRPPDRAERPPAPKLQVDTEKVNTRHMPQPLDSGRTIRTVNSYANPNNSTRG